MNERLVWVDCEMTGLNLEDDALIEIAALVTEPDLTPLDEGIDIVISAEDFKLDNMTKVVRDMHDKSGLTKEVRRSVTTMVEAEDQVLEYVQKHVPDPGTAPLCGNSIATDRAFLLRDMPRFNDFLHYRMIDVSSLKELCRRWYPRVYFNQPEKGLQHRALSDILDSIRELTYYQQAVLVPQPGPDSDSAKAIAEALNEQAKDQ